MSIMSIILGATPLGWVAKALKLAPLIFSVAVIGYLVFYAVSCSQTKNVSTIATQKATIDQVASDNKSLVKDTADIKATGDETLKAVIKNSVNNTEVDKKISIREISIRETTVTKKIQAKNTELDAQLEKSIETEKQRIDFASGVQIDAIWATFCEASPNSSQCKA